MSKATGVTLPFLLLVLDRWPLGRTGRTPWSALVREKLPLIAMAIALSLVTVLAPTALQQPSSAVQ